MEVSPRFPSKRFYLDLMLLFTVLFAWSRCLLFLILTFFLFISFCVCIRSYLSKFIFLHLEKIVIVILFIFSDISDKVFFYPEYPFQTAKLLSSHPPRVLISRLASPSPGQIHWNRGWGAGGSMGKRSSASSPMSPSASLGVDTEALMLSSECSFDVAHVSNLLARIIEVRCQSDSLV